jgi:hypothetical protein
MRAESLRANRRPGNIQARGRDSNAAQVRDRSRPGRREGPQWKTAIPPRHGLRPAQRPRAGSGVRRRLLARRPQPRRTAAQRGKGLLQSPREVEAAWGDGGCAVVRIREDPLEPLHHHDIQAPARSDPATCAKAVLIHLAHVLYPDFPGSRDDEERAVSFLRSSASPLASGDLRCSECRKAASYLLPNQAFPHDLPGARDTANGCRPGRRVLVIYLWCTAAGCSWPSGRAASMDGSGSLMKDRCRSG